MSTLTNAVKKIANFFSGDVTIATTDAIATPKFLLPETGVEYIKALSAERNAWNEYERECKKFRNEKDVRLKNASTEVEKERIRREEFQPAVVPLERRGRYAIEKELRQKEQKRIIDDSTMVFSSFIWPKPEDRERLQFWFREERRIVLFGGRHYLFMLKHIEITRGTGKFMKTWCEADYRERRYTVEIQERTGEYYPPTIEWGTDSLGQFSNQELASIG